MLYPDDLKFEDGQFDLEEYAIWLASQDGPTEDELLYASQ
jgi:hypothetical protein